MTTGEAMGKLDYLVKSALRSATPDRLACPDCGGQKSVLVERKYAVTALRRCSACLLMFRTPNDDPGEACAFYNADYDQGFTTDCPSPERLEELKADGFSGQDNDYAYYISVLRALGVQPGATLFDFGCSWGYGSYQLAQAGFDVLSTEISQPRAAYAAQNLGVRLAPDLIQTAFKRPHSMDVFFSSHVLEHVPAPSSVIHAARMLVRPGGLFVSFFPNGSAANRASHPNWSGLWGKVHPNFLDDAYLNHAVPDRPRLFAASPAVIGPNEAAWLRETTQPAALYLNDLRAMEMMFAFRV